MKFLHFVTVAVMFPLLFVAGCSEPDCKETLTCVNGSGRVCPPGQVTVAIDYPEVTLSDGICQEPSSLCVTAVGDKIQGCKGEVWRYYWGTRLPNEILLCLEDQSKPSVPCLSPSDWVKE